MNAWIAMFLLGVLQGIAEFLPISSSGHLNIAQAAIEQFWQKSLPSDSITVTIALHFGTLLSILVVYWHRIWRLLGDDRQVVGRVIVGTIPAGIVGVALNEWMEVSPEVAKIFDSPLLSGCMLPVTGLMLILGARRSFGETDYLRMSYRQALLVGVAQAFAILPGISRSGSTIVAGLLVGLRRDSAATFSFLLAIPVTAGACLIKSRKLFGESLSTDDAGALLFGTIISFVVGVLALRWLLLWLGAGRLDRFAWWCIPVGLFVVAWQLVA